MRIAIDLRSFQRGDYTAALRLRHPMPKKVTSRLKVLGVGTTPQT